MTQPHTPEPSEPGTEEAGFPAAKRSFRERYAHLPRRRGTRLLALGAAVVVLAGVAGVAAVASHHPFERGGEFGDKRPGYAAAEGRDGRGPQGQDHRKHAGNEIGAGKRIRAGQGNGPEGLAPAPLPALPAGQAVEKAAAAVPGGKVDALRVVGQQGGGSAWQLDVLGTDGVRHLVTVDGVNGTVTGNTVADR